MIKYAAMNLTFELTCMRLVMLRDMFYSAKLCILNLPADFSGIALDIIQYSDEAVCFQRTFDLFIGLHCKAYVAIMYILVS